MREHDEEIDGVLRALGGAEVTPGLDARILLRLAAAPAPQARWPMRLGWCFGAALAVALVGIALRPAHRPGTALKIEAKQELDAVPPAPPQAFEHVVSRGQAVTRPREATMMLAGTAPSRGAADLPTMLAPEPPVTAEERILLRVAHGPTPEDLALMNPDTRERLAQQSAAEFKQFFPPPTPQEIYLATHTND